MSHESAKTEAWRYALLLSQGDREIAAAILQGAEGDVMREMLVALLPGGESEYWCRVSGKLRR